MHSAGQSYNSPGFGTEIGARPHVGSTAKIIVDSVADFLINSVPALTAKTLALCRILFGLMLATFIFVATPASLGSLATLGSLYRITKLIDGNTGILTFLSADPLSRSVIFWLTLVLLLAFVLGLFTRFLRSVHPGLLRTGGLRQGDPRP
jgi:hypothetical protein